MNTFKYPTQAEIEQIIERPIFDTSSLTDSVTHILKEVKQRGDEAIRLFTERFDGIALPNLKVTKDEISQASRLVSPELKTAIKRAAKNIECFHQLQKQEIARTQTEPGVFCAQKSVPIEKVGLYIPGGTAPLFSTVLMLAIPAKIAGCNNIILTTPPDKQGKIHPSILFIAEMAGITQIFKVGGAQAIAAMAYGTETIPKVLKIFGPGNQYVTLAKQLVSLEHTAIDMPAGPSELAVIADETAIPEFIASDLLSQAEHGDDSQVIFVTTSQQVLYETQKELEKQLGALPRRQIAQKALTNSSAVLVKNLKEGMHIINRYAPEHLILASENPAPMAELVQNAGSVFIGNYTPESAGDYASGTNHTLPTNGFARMYSGLNLDAFVKKITFQEILPLGIRNLGPTIEIMAENEQLFAHKNAVTLRLNYLKSRP